MALLSRQPSQAIEAAVALRGGQRAAQPVPHGPFTCLRPRSTQRLCTRGPWTPRWGPWPPPHHTFHSLGSIFPTRFPKTPTKAANREVTSVAEPQTVAWRVLRPQCLGSWLQSRGVCVCVCVCVSVCAPAVFLCLLSRHPRGSECRPHTAGAPTHLADGPAPPTLRHPSSPASPPSATQVASWSPAPCLMGVASHVGLKSREG